MKGAILTAAITILVAGTVFGVTAWKNRSHVGGGPLANVELRWLREYAAWSAPIDRAIQRGTRISSLRCRDEAARRVGDAPSKRLTRVARLVLTACRILAAEAVPDRTQSWFTARQALGDVLTMNLPLPTRLGQTDVSRIDPRLSRFATLIADRSTQVRCWSVDGWLHVATEWRVLTSHVPEFWPLGIADKVRGRTDLAPEVCAPLETSLAQGPPPGSTNNERYVLTEALMIFAHEAEHHRNPQAAEAVVECYAIQDIRRVAILFNGTKTFANEAALLARDVAYPRQYASYRTRACRAGGPLDRTPGDGRWP